MQQSLLYIFTALLLLLSTSCSKQVVEALDNAGKTIGSQPDSALHYLNTIDRSDLWGEENGARYALLYTQALGKNAIDVTDDSLALVAVDYYSENGTPEQRAMAYYYLGRVYENDSDTERTIINMTLAKNVVPNSCSYLKGLIYSRLGSLYYTQGDYKESIQLLKIALKAYQNGGVLRNEAIVYDQLANCTKLISNYDLALEYENQANNIYHQLKDTVGILRSYRSLEYTKQLQGDPPSQILERVNSYYDKYNYGEVVKEQYHFMANLYALTPNAVSTQHII